MLTNKSWFTVSNCLIAKGLTLQLIQTFSLWPHNQMARQIVAQLWCHNRSHIRMTWKKPHGKPHVLNMVKGQFYTLNLKLFLTYNVFYKQYYMLPAIFPSTDINIRVPENCQLCWIFIIKKSLVRQDATVYLIVLSCKTCLKSKMW